jgi:hypothetical protein
MINLVALDNNSIEQTFLRGPASNYISIYASTYPENYESSRDMKITRARLNYAIGNCKPEDLHILASVPRTSLVPKISTGLAWDECPMLSIPIKMTNPDALKTLATVFHGPIEVSQFTDLRQSRRANNFASLKLPTHPQTLLLHR